MQFESWGGNRSRNAGQVLFKLHFEGSVKVNQVKKEGKGILGQGSNQFGA